MRWLILTAIVLGSVRTAHAVDKGTIEGQVLGSTGPMAGVLVKALQVGVDGAFDWGIEALRDPDQDRDFVRRAHEKAKELGRASTGKDGKFRIAPLPAGKVALWADAGERGQALLEAVEVGSAPLTVTLAAALLLDGDSVLRNGEEMQCVAGVDVVAVHAKQPLYFHATTDRDGNFRLGYAPPGDYFVLGAKKGLLPATAWKRPEKEKAPAGPAAGASAASTTGEPPSDDPPIPRPRLYFDMSLYHHRGSIYLPFELACSLVGSVHQQGKPVRDAIVKLRVGAEPDLLRMARTTDAAGRFQFLGAIGCQNVSYGIEATKGDLLAYDCIQMPGLADDHCCGTAPDSKVSDGFPTCTLRLSLQKVPPSSRASFLQAAIDRTGECQCRSWGLEGFLPSPAPSEPGK